MRQNLLKNLMSIALVIIATFGVSQAQVTTSSVAGQVVDAQGEPLPGANIVAMHEPSGTRYGAVSNLDGRFTIPNMRIGGPYTIQISFIGYQVAGFENVILRLGEPYLLSATLQDDSTELGEVVVSAAKSSEFDSNKTGTSTSISTKQLTDLPQINRSVTEFTRLTPQANGNSFAGRDSRYNNFQVDGANFNNGFGLSGNALPGGNAQPISLDAIEQISVNIAPFDVTQSGFTGAGINAVTRSGTNTLQGSAYYFTKNQDLQGNKIGDNELESVDAGTKNFGFRLGGPIIKNKLFFFVNAERENETGANASGTNLWRSSADGVADAENNITRVTTSDMEAVKNHLINQWGYDPGRYEGYANEAEQHNTKFLARIDWNINERHKLAVRYNQVVGISNQLTNGASGPNPRTPNDAFRVSQNSMSFENSNYGFENSVRSLTAELNSTLSPRVSNQFLFTYSKIKDIRTTPSDQLFPMIDIWDGGGFIEDEEGNLVRNYGSKNYITAGTELFSYKNDVINDNFSFTNNLTYVTGKHTVTAGAAFEIQKFGNSYTRMGTSYYRYASVEEFLTTGTANEIAPTMFGLTYPYEGQDTYARINFGQASLYAQDKFAATDRLSLTLGLRFELPIYLNELTANQSINDLTLLDTDGNPKNYDSGSWPESRLMVSPRFGFNYDISGDRSFVVRGGTGVFTGRVPFVWLTNMPTNAGVLQNTIEPNGYSAVAPWIENITFQPEQYYYVENPPAGGENVFITSPKDGAPGSFALVDAEFRMPMVWRSSLGADYQLGNSPFVLTADLIYTRDVNAVYQFGANRKASPNKMTYAEGDNREVTLAPSDIQYNPAMGANNATILTNTDLKGHAFSATAGLLVPDWRGLSGSVYYTYSEAKEVSANSGSAANSAWLGSPSINSPNEQMMNISNYALPHRVVANLSYRIEYANRLATTVGMYYTGSHQGRFSYLYGNDFNGDGINADILFLPDNTSEIVFTDIVSSGNVVFTAAEQAAAFDKYIADNDLEQYRGQYVPRNAFLMPWLSRFDVRVLQDVFTNIGSRKHTLQLSLDIVNFGNLLNQDWGIQDNLNGAQNLLSRSGSASQNPSFNMNRVSGELPTTPFQNASSFSTTWSMQFGLRYIF